MIEVHLILGFLGAGKTTFIKSYLRSLPDLRSLLLIVNDFGQEGFDAEILKGEGVEAVELSQGCLCCGLAESFYQVLLESTKRKDIKRILIEPSGVFIPEIVARLFKDPVIAQKMVLQPVIGIINSALFTERDFTRMPFIQKQIQHSDRIVLNRTRDIHPGRFDELKQRILELSPHAQIFIDPADGDVPSIVNTKHQETNAPIVTDDDSGELNHSFNTVRVRDGLEFPNQSALREWFTSKGKRLVRAKGVVIIEGCKMLVNYTPTELNSSDSPKTIDIGITLIFENPILKTIDRSSPLPNIG